ncbi:MAG: four helix bundle protein [Ignavibacteria bacterium]|nr:four helix bundle protein [Ignavibacteria bacterium]
MNKHELEERLINFAVLIIEIVNELPQTKAAIHLSNQLIRSGTSPALNYGEAQSGESRKDFIHKIKIVLKELRETFVCLKIIDKAKLYQASDHTLMEKELKLKSKIERALKESNELISIFVKSVETAQRNIER